MRLAAMILMLAIGGGAAGCLVPNGDAAAIKTVVDDIKAVVTATGQVAAQGQVATAEGGVDQSQNDPVVSWILAGGSTVVVPLCFLAYVISKRTSLYHWLSGVKKGG